MSAEALFIGLDLGTGGVRAVAVTAAGEVVASGTATLTGQAVQEGWHEQEPEMWWQATGAAMQALGRELEERGASAAACVAVAVDGTSGTLVCVDNEGRALRPAIMYNDQRAEAEAAEVTARAGVFCEKLGYTIGGSFAAARIRWIQLHEPAVFETTRWFLHQADFIANRLTGQFGVADYSNALKTGYDLVDECWPDWWSAFDGVSERLPRVLAPGTPLGPLQEEVAGALGLPAGVMVVSGATDGTAGFLASGAHRVGDDNTTLGTTLVFKRLAARLAKDATGLIYSHKLPGGFWLPGAASNTGGEWIRRDYEDADLTQLDAQASRILPSQHLAYPLARSGERFPFKVAQAAGFCLPQAQDALGHYAAHLQGVALTERLGYEVLDRIATVPQGDIYATGAASRSDAWLQLRADVSGRKIHRPGCPESAFGSAVLAAAALQFDDVWGAVQSMVHIDRTFVPDANRAASYDELYQKFKGLLAERGYL